MDVELVEVRDFLAAHHPFDELPRQVVDALPPQLLSRYYRRGTNLVEAGAANTNLFILRSGAVDIIDGNGHLHDRADPGQSFGLSSVMTGSASLFTLHASEDSLCLLMPSGVFHHLIETQPAFARHYMEQQAGRMREAVQTVTSDDAGSALMRTSVRDIIRFTPITTTPEATIREAASVMDERRVSALLITRGETLVGILTDRDLRRVVAQGLDVDAPASTIMTPNPSTISPDKLAFDVLVELTQNRFHHIPVVEDGRVIGMITAGDIMRLEQANPTFLVGDIARQTTLAGLKRSIQGLGTVVETAVSADATADDIARVVTAIGDAVVRKLIELAELDLGPAPVPWCWVTLGSQARYELGLQSDQDSAIIISDAMRPEHEAWFADLATRVVDGLEACGFERCPGDMMASNPTWRVTLSQWGQYFRTWINEPEPDALLNAQTFFDMRPVYGDTTLFEHLHEAVAAWAPRSSRFLAYLAKQAQRFTPPIGFFRDFVLEGEGDHKDTLDLKAGGVAPVVQMARLFCLSKASGETNTLARLRGAAQAGALSPENAADLADAFEFINYVRVRHQVRQLKAGVTPDNHVPPSALSSFEKRHLRNAFQIIRKMQGALAYVHRTDITS